MSSLSADVKSDLTLQLRRNYKAIGVKYASYVRCIRKLLKEKEVSADDLCADLLNLPFFKCNQAAAADLKNANSVNEIFITLTSVCSFWDYDIFQFLTSEYDLDEGQEKLQYQEHFQSYIEEHKVSEFVAINPLLTDYESIDFKKLTLKFDIDVVKCSLAKVIELKEVVATCLKVNPSTLRLVSIQEGCIEVTFLIPAPKIDAVFTGDWKQISERSEELQAASLLSITCNDNTFNTKERKLTATQSKKEKDEVSTSSKSNYNG